MGEARTLFITYDRGLAEEVTALRKELERQLRLDLDRGLRIVQDVDFLATGDDWKKKVDECLAHAIILIVVVTRSVLDSEECRREILYFDKKISNGTLAAIAPVLMREATEIFDRDDPDQRAGLSDVQKSVVKILRRNNYFDGLIFFRQPPTSSAYKARVEELAKDLKKKITDLDAARACAEAASKQIAGQPSSHIAGRTPSASDGRMPTAATLGRAGAQVKVEPRKQDIPMRVTRRVLAFIAVGGTLAAMAALVATQYLPHRPPNTPSIAWKEAELGTYLRNERSQTARAVRDPNSPDVVVDQIQPGALRPLAGADNARIGIGTIKGQVVWYRYMALDGKAAYVAADGVVLKRR